MRFADVIEEQAEAIRQEGENVARTVEPAGAALTGTARRDQYRRQRGARKALARSRVEAPHVFVPDIGLPDIDGNALARPLRARPGTAAAVPVAPTGYGLSGDRVRTAAAGFDQHLVEPVAAAQVYWILAQAHPAR